MKIELENLTKKHTFKAALKLECVDFGTISYDKKSRLFTKIRKKGLIRRLDDVKAELLMPLVRKHLASNIFGPSADDEGLEIYEIIAPFKFRVRAWGGMISNISASPNRNFVFRIRTDLRNYWAVL